MNYGGTLGQTLGLIALLGFASGLRTFTGVAALMLAQRGIVGFVLAAFALGEYAADLHPKCPSRTSWPGLVGRSVAGAFCGGWMMSHAERAIAPGLVVGVSAALVGAYVGKACRVWGIARLGPIPAGMIESAIAVGIAAFAVTR